MKLLSSLVIAIVLGLSPGVAPASTVIPAQLPATPSPASCRVDPVAPEHLASLLSTPVAATPVSEIDLNGVPASEDVIRTVRQVMSEIFTCFNAGEPMRAYNLYSDEYLRRILAKETPESITLLSTPDPLAAGESTSIIDIRDIRLLDDGRVYAIVILDPGLIPVQKIFGFFLIHQDGRWLVDDVLDELRFSLP